MAMIGKVRRLHRRQNKTVREIARLTSLSPVGVMEPFGFRHKGASRFSA
jgi:hypothetical protein